jgi:hypothetical protein
LLSASPTSGAAPRARLDSLRELMPLEIRRQQIRPDTEVPARPAVKDATHDLHVLLRHRLLLKSDSFEGFRAIEEDPLAGDGGG